MPKPIRLALQRTLVLVLALLIPASGSRRRRGLLRPTPVYPRTLSGLRLLIRRTAPPEILPASTAKPRTAVRTAARPLLDDPSPLVRPYLVAHERHRRQQERRTALVLALDGIDVGPWVIHGHHIGTPVGTLAGVAV
ncbi:hypothetical protein [Streptomyces sp. DSM 40750]|uniref:hypothetical protein n=1 Tax=Streptomyces sp. DSM 40750 TaxID=2801030 RepID=UPI00214C0463|nr:hypothetical protein [Streptomyces sp. DSM 40750]UUU23912.1 hypothetical protein JIX55_28665 [Streptomyces sp. DSM 40750]